MSEDDLTDDQIRKIAEQMGAPVPKPKEPTAGERWDTTYEMLTLSPWRWRLLKTVHGETTEQGEFNEWQKASEAIIELEAKGFHVIKDPAFTYSHARLGYLDRSLDTATPTSKPTVKKSPVLEVEAFEDYGPGGMFGRRFILTQVNEYGKRLQLLNTFDAARAKAEVLRYQSKGWTIRRQGETA